MAYQPDPDDRFVVHDPSGHGDRWLICDKWHRDLPFAGGYSESVSGEEGSAVYLALVQR